VLLIAVTRAGTERVVTALQAKGIPVATIGEVRPGSERLTMMVDGVSQPLVPSERDEIGRTFDL
jgi:hydrogenase maturation factor